MKGEGEEKKTKPSLRKVNESFWSFFEDKGTWFAHKYCIASATIEKLTVASGKQCNNYCDLVY